MKLKALFLLAVACSLGTRAQPQLGLEVIVLKYRDADDLIPVIRKLIGNDGFVSGSENRLVLQTKPQELERIKKVIARLDVRPVSLRVSVRSDVGASQSGSAAGVFVGHGRGGVILRDRRSGQVGRGEQSVNVLDGAQAKLEVTTASGKKTELSLRPRKMSSDLTEIDVEVRLEGDVVKTKTAVHPGDWVQLGSSSIEDQGSQTDIGAIQSADKLRSLKVEIKVDYE